MVRQLLLCCDGTNNNLTGGRYDTAVVKLCELLALSSDPERLLFYDPGVGNPGELPGATIFEQIKRISERIGGLAFGLGVYQNMADGYRFLMRHYRPGDQLFIFGFSRGAFTARSIAGMVNRFGLLEPQMEAMVPTLLHLYFTDDDSRSKADPISAQAKRLFASAGSRAVPIHFVGVWDTVASVGMWPFSTRFTSRPDVAGKHYVHVRQALALDELRAQFKPRLYLGDNGAHVCADGSPGTLTQLWFRGGHCDIGGGYARAEAGLSVTPQAWLVSEAVGQGLRLLDAAGQPLSSEAAVLQALQGIDGGPPAPPRVNSELQRTCLWALTGMEQRVSDRVLLDDGSSPRVQAVEHPSVAAWDPAFPQGTAWAAARPKAVLLAGLVALPLLLWLLGWLQSGALDPLTAMAANTDFARWQLLWWADGGLRRGLDGFAHPGWALAADQLLIAAYAYVLAWFAVAAFARHTGLRRAGRPVSTWLNRLGWALPLAVFADLGENAASYLTLVLLHFKHEGLAMVSGAAMSLLTLANFAGLAGTLLLIVSGWLRRPGR
nr:DUF2235 domain-containing protein [uncultured Roseateles sp.]